MPLSDQLAKEIMEGKGDKLIDAIVYKLIADPKFARKVAEGLLGKVATREDVEKLKEKLEGLASKGEVEKLREEIVRLERVVATKEELKEVEERLSSKVEENRKEIAEIKVKMVTKDELNEVKSEITEIKANMVTKEDLEKIRSEIKGEINELGSTFNTMLRWIIGLLASMWVSVVVGIIIALIKMMR